MINTELHNKLINKEMEKKVIEHERINQQARRAVLFEKLKLYALIVGFIFLVLLMLEVLLWLFPINKSFDNQEITRLEKMIEKKVCECNTTSEKTIDKKTTGNSSMKNTNKYNTKADQNKQTKTDKVQKGEPKNGKEYVKHDNYVFERTWKDGYLIKERKLEETIKGSRQKGEKIPNKAIPLNKEKNIDTNK